MTPRNQEIAQRARMLREQGKSFTYVNFSTKSEYGYPRAPTAEFIAWQTRAANLLRQTFGADSAPVRVLDSALAVAVLGNGSDKFDEMSSKMLGALDAAASILEDDHFGELRPENSDEDDGAAPSSRVFIVHGHDAKAKGELEILLRDIGLEPIVLHRQPDEGQTVIEKFERYTDVGYAFVVLTPDDVAYSADQDALADGARQKEWRARQNVILELGFFIGRLGRSRVCCLYRGCVCCLYRGSVTLPSDINGLLYKRFEQSVEEVAYAIIKELRAVGYGVKV
jgi:predicted nucleotide-binding protein